MMKKPIIIFIGFVFLFTGCKVQNPVYSSTIVSNNNFFNPTSVSTEVPSTETKTPLHPILLTPTVIPPTVESIGMQKIPTEFSEIIKCKYPRLASDRYQTIQFDGTIAFQNQDTKGYSLLNGKSQSINTLQINWNINNHFIGFSPNGNWLAYITDNKKIILLSSEGEKKEIKYDLNIFDTRRNEGLKVLTVYPLEWINDRLLYYTVEYDTIKNVHLSRSIIYQAIFNPFTGKWEDFSNILPNWDQNTFTYPSPDGNRILYTGEIQSQGAAILWDISLAKEIWDDLGYQIFPIDIFDQHLSISAFQWAPDSSKFASLGYQNGSMVVRIFSKDGEILDIIPTGLSDDYSLLGPYIKWAPNSRSLSFYIPNYDDLSNSATIYIYDLNSKKFMFQCGVSLDNPDWGWVSDQYIGYSRSRNGDLFLIDVKTGLINSLLHEGNFIGWSPKTFTMGETIPSITPTPRIKTPEG